MTSSFDTLDAVSQQPVIGHQLKKILKDAADLDSMSPLTAAEQVMIKDTWNKFHAYRSIGSEALVARLFLEVPWLEQLLGGLGDELEEILVGFLDLVIRELQPHTEKLGKEATCPVHLDEDILWRDVKEYATFFADTGLELEHWEMIREVWIWALQLLPILEEYELKELQRGERSAFWRFFSLYVIKPMWKQLRKHDMELEEKNWSAFVSHWHDATSLRAEHIDGLTMALVSHDLLEDLDIELVIGTVESWFDVMDQAIELWPDWPACQAMLAESGQALLARGVPASAMLEIGVCFGIWAPMKLRWPSLAEKAACRFAMKASIHLHIPARQHEFVFDKAQEWLELLAKEHNWSDKALAHRIEEVRRELLDTGTYTHTFEELEHGARVAWRNASKCIGRVNWNKMIVRDCRDVHDPDAMFEEVLQHLQLASSGDNVEIVMTVFPPKEPLERWGTRFWNTQFARYAGYVQEDGSVLGDEANVELTEASMSLGWVPPTPRTQFDLLPHIIQVPGQEPRMYEWPEGALQEVELHHPSISAFSELGLKWNAIPVVCNIGLDLGGIRYTCAPFNGWFMGTEIARDLFDTFRYDKAEAIAEVLGLDCSSEVTLWRDRAFLELNVAILDSFQKARVTLVDHHTASRQFLTHDRREKKAGRECPARWSWIVPPMSGSVCEVFHHEMREFFLEPAYRDMSNRWQVEIGDLRQKRRHEQARRGGSRVLVLYGSESGTAENFAYQAGRRLKALQPTVKALDECTPEELETVELLLVITSTFGNGDLPENAVSFAKWLEAQPDTLLKGISYGVMGLGNSIYEHYCAAGVYYNQLLQRKGAYRMIPLHKGDELKGQARRFQTWIERIARVFQVNTTAVPATVDVTWLPVDDQPAPPIHTRWVRANVLQNQELIRSRAKAPRSVRLLTLDAAEAGIPYETGDYLSVYPDHDDDLIDRLCVYFEVDPERWFTIQGAQVPFSMPTTPRRVFQEELDLSLVRAPKKLLEVLVQLAQNKDEAEELRGLLSEWNALGHSPFASVFLADRFGDVMGLLEAFPSASLSFGQCVTMLPRQKARLYSISSGAELRPDTIDLTVSVVQFSTTQKVQRTGLCSGYLSRVSVGDQIRVLVRPSEFAPPGDLTTPMLLIGPGTGVAPFMGFLEQRQALLEQQDMMATEAAPVWLYFGCRNQSHFLHHKQLHEWQEEQLLARLRVAFSRKPKRKQYVQDLLRLDQNELWAFLCRPDCRVYICGDTQMAEDVTQVLVSIAHDVGEMTIAESASWLASLRAEGRWATDVWSSVLSLPAHKGE